MQIPGDPAADVGDRLVGQPHQVEVVGDDERLGQRLGDRGPVGRARVHRHHLDGVLPRLTALVEPGHHVGLRAARRLPEQALAAAQIDEVGLERLQLAPDAGVGVLRPAGPAAAGLIDPEHRHRLRLGQVSARLGDPGRMSDRPADQPRAGRGDWQPFAHPVGDVPTQPPGHPGPSRHLVDLLGERHPAAGALLAGVLDLVPAHQQRRLAVGQVTGRCRPPLPDAGGDHPVRLACRRGLVVGEHVHGAPAVRGAHNLPHPNSGQAEQDRRTV
jgi:hypothetical protein